MLVLLIVLALMLLGVFGIVVLVNTGNAQKKAEQDSKRILDETFDGRPDVTFTLNMRTLKYDTVVLGAKERGYNLVHQASDKNGPRTLIFSAA